MDSKVGATDGGGERLRPELQYALRRELEHRRRVGRPLVFAPDENPENPRAVLVDEETGEYAGRALDWAKTRLSQELQPSFFETEFVQGVGIFVAGVALGVAAWFLFGPQG